MFYWSAPEHSSPFNLFSGLSYPAAFFGSVRNLQGQDEKKYGWSFAFYTHSLSLKFLTLGDHTQPVHLSAELWAWWDWTKQKDTHNQECKKNTKGLKDDTSLESKLCEWFRLVGRLLTRPGTAVSGWCWIVRKPSSLVLEAKVNKIRVQIWNTHLRV